MLDQKTQEDAITILYVEDEEVVREGYARALNRMTPHLLLAENGEEGLAIYKKHRPDIVVSDIRMPGMDGIEMLKAIREIDPDANFIFTTAHNDSHYMLEALEYQVNAYLQKPVSKNMLREKIEKIAAQIRQVKELELHQKEIERQKIILQEVLDHEKSLLVVSNFKEVYFANRAFLEHFGVSSIEAFNALCHDLIDLFLPLPGYLHRNMLKAQQTFYELVEQSEETERVVTMIGATTQPGAYQISIAPIALDNHDAYLISLTDITQFNIQRLSTEKKAYHDTLTGIYNRTKFDTLFDAELERVKRYGTESTMVLLDIDHFKRFNDTYGHLVGDKVLKILAETISANIRSTDIFARWGGEEFILLLPETALEGACMLVEKLRKKVEEIVIDEAEPITASFGVTQLRREDTAKSAFVRVDAALYDAKSAGRNCVRCSVDPLPSAAEVACEA